MGQEHFKLLVGAGLVFKGSSGTSAPSYHELRQRAPRAPKILIDLYYKDFPAMHFYFSPWASLTIIRRW